MTGPQDLPPLSYSMKAHAETTSSWEVHKGLPTSVGLDEGTHGKEVQDTRAIAGSSNSRGRCQRGGPWGPPGGSRIEGEAMELQRLIDEGVDEQEALRIVAHNASHPLSRYHRMDGPRNGSPGSSCPWFQSGPAARKREPCGTWCGGSVYTEDSRIMPMHKKGSMAKVRTILVHDHQQLCAWLRQARMFERQDTNPPA